MKTPAARLGVRVCTIAVAVSVAIGLAACAPPTTSASSSAHPASPSKTPGSTAVPTPTATSTPTRFAEDCSILLTSPQVYAYNPNYVVDSSYVPEAGTIPAAITAAMGKACGWVNETSGDVIAVAVATPGATGLAAAKAAASSGASITTNGEQGYFAVTDGIGSAQFFIGTLWLDLSSRDFTVPDDAAQLYPVVVHNQLTAGG